MERRTLLAMIPASLLAAPLVAEAQPAGKLYRIGFLGTGNLTSWGPGIEALRLGLQDHGYVEGRNITIEYRWAENRYDRLPELAAELVRLNLDVIITHGTPCTLALKRATSTTPIVMSIIGNPVENGAVARLARPGEEALPGDKVRLTFRIVLGRRAAEALSARAIRAEKNLDVLVTELLEAAASGRGRA
jgi:putative ABC transport system substrate-binding protein